MKYKINLTEKEKSDLEKVVRKQSISQNIAKRAKIILMADGREITNLEIGRRLGVRYEDITKWTKRWLEESNVEAVDERLKDRARSGRKPRITAEQWCKIMALACEKPESYGVPITHWSHSTLTAEIIKQGIVETISMSHVGDFLKKRNYNLTKVSIG
ncbi:MAG: Unknown protein [uncultured Sulfurovum sp.]|uniref:Uncharacterized protein n=1 Tax=uncultured Sulfurovum sp. TaxID=269237 RepID=A0A6S6U8F9_9BACT|nr:MAG: Unknown protein [uncultured Sulfurovum sp.]